MSWPGGEVIIGVLVRLDIWAPPLVRGLRVVCCVCVCIVCVNNLIMLPNLTLHGHATRTCLIYSKTIKIWEPTSSSHESEWAWKKNILIGLVFNQWIILAFWFSNSSLSFANYIAYLPNRGHQIIESRLIHPMYAKLHLVSGNFQPSYCLAPYMCHSQLNQTSGSNIFEGVPYEKVAATSVPRIRLK